MKRVFTQHLSQSRVVLITIAALVLFGLQVLWIWNSVQKLSNNIEHLNQIHNLRGEVVLQEESLANAVLLAAVSDNTRWVDDFARDEQQLRNTLNNLKDLTKNYDLDEGSDHAISAHEQILAYAKSAIALLEEGRNSEALDIVQGDKFAELLLQTRQGMESTLVQTGVYAKELSINTNRDLAIATASLILFILIILLGSYAILRNNRRLNENQLKTLSNAITQRDHLELELTQSEQRLAHILESSPVGTAVINNDDQFTYINSRYANLCGLGKADIVGIQWHDHPNINHSDGDIVKFLELARRGEPCSVELRVSKNDKPENWVKLSASPIDLENQSMIIVTLEDIQHLREAKKQLNEERYSDMLTRLPNRVAMLKHIQAWLHVSSRSPESAALLHIDVDHFKRINDGLGEQAADSILHSVARRLYKNNASNRYLARNSGDEFLLFLREADLNHSIEIAEELLEQVREPYLINNRSISITASIGILPLPCGVDDAQELLRQAESAAYLAKSSGRNTYRVYHSELNEESARRLLMENRLRTAIEHETLDVHYQPIIDLATSTVVGAEALIRWTDDELGTITPNEFIPLAEELQLTGELAMLVFERTCTDFDTLNHFDNKDFSIAINCSAQQLEDEQFIITLLVNNEIKGISNRHFEFEITERVLMADSPVLATNLDRLVAAGYRLSIDDFGTGYSALSYLKKYPFHTVKIDRSFVMDLEYDNASSALCQAVVGMADALDMTTVAEGIENEAQEKLLTEMGAELGQGFYYSPALPPEDFSEWLKAYPRLAENTVKRKQSGAN